jgi:hypothetical protein
MQDLTPPAPDLIEPVQGWRVWDVVALGGSLRLCSLAFWSIWRPHEQILATCRRSLVDAALTGLPPHPAPQPSCSCGIYATRTAPHVLEFSRQVKRRFDTVHRVAGLVSLWGSVVESEDGWRASNAYPASIVVPTFRPRSFRLTRRPARPLLDVEEIAWGLAEYGIRVEIVEAADERELGRALEPAGASGC